MRDSKDLIIRPLKPSTLKAILTDSQFWAPLIVLALGIALLIYLH